MDFKSIYKCLEDGQRLRILNLLKQGPLCVCHLQELLGEDQVKMSKQLAYMRRLGMVTGEREGMWMVYRMKEPASELLLENLRVLGVGELREAFAADDRGRALILERIRCTGLDCPEAVLVAGHGCCE